MRAHFTICTFLFCFVLCLFLCACTLKKGYKKPQQNNSILTTKPWCYGPVLTALSMAQQTILMGQTTQSSLRLSGGCDLQESMECVFFGQSSVIFLQLKLTNQVGVMFSDESLEHCSSAWLTRGCTPTLETEWYPRRADILLRWPGSLSLLLIGIHMTSCPCWARTDCLGGLTLDIVEAGVTNCPKAKETSPDVCPILNLNIAVGPLEDKAVKRDEVTIQYGSCHLCVPLLMEATQAPRARAIHCLCHMGI